VRLIKHFHEVVKAETDALDENHSSDWDRALSASYTAVTVDVRNELAKNILILFACIGSTLSYKHGQAIATFIAGLRGLTLLQEISRTPLRHASQLADQLEQRAAKDYDVSAGLDALRVSSPFGSNAINKVSGNDYTVMSRITVSPETQFSLFDTSQATLRATGLFTSLTPSHVTAVEVDFLNNLRMIGEVGLVAKFANIYPQTAAVLHLRGLIFLSGGQCQDAERCFIVVGGQMSKLVFWLNWTNVNILFIRCAVYFIGRR
jgi:hypothetical protein